MKKIDWDLINHQNKQAKQKCWSGWAVHGLICTFVFCLFLIVWLIRFTFLFQIQTLGCREMHSIAGKIDHCEWKGQWKKSMSGWREQNLWWVIYIFTLSLCILGNFHAFVVIFWLFKINFFPKILSGTLTECQTVWI